MNIKHELVSNCKTTTSGILYTFGITVNLMETIFLHDRFHDITFPVNWLFYVPNCLQYAFDIKDAIRYILNSTVRIFIALFGTDFKYSAMSHLLYYNYSTACFSWIHFTVNQFRFISIPKIKNNTTHVFYKNKTKARKLGR